MAPGKEKPKDKGPDVPRFGHSLRDYAEEQLAAKKSLPDFAGKTPEEIIHELQVHQIELEMQAEELRRAHLELEESRDRYLDLYDFAPVGYLTLSDKALIEEVNLTGALLLGIERNKLLKAPFSKFIPKKDYGPWHQFFQSVLSQEEKQTCTLMLTPGDGFTFPARLEGVRITDRSDGTPVVRVAISNITDIRQAEQALCESEERYRKLAESTSDMIFIHDIEGTFRYMNPAGAKMIGFSSDEIVGKKIPSVFPPAVASLQWQALSRTFATAQPLHSEMEVPLKGENRWLDCTLIPLKAADGTVATVMGTVQDVTERKAGEVRLKQFNEELERGIADRTEKLTASLMEKEILLREVHHRVNNNLQILNSLLNMQVRSVPDETVRAALRETQNRVNAMALVHEKLYRSTEISRINLEEYIRALGTHLFQVYGVRKGIGFTTDILNISVDIDSAIPLGLILNELISNSLQHAFPGGRNGEVSIRALQKTPLLFIQIMDDGVGMPRDLDCHNAKTLGLRLVTSLVEQLNGTIEFDTEHGSRYTITMPVEKKPETRP